MLNMPLNPNVICIFQHPEFSGKTALYFIDGNIEYIDLTPEQLITDTLLYFGSNIKTRKQSAKVLANISHHLPIIIEAHLKWMYFPVHQTKTHFQMYVNHRMIYTIEGTKEQSVIYFINGQSIKVNQRKNFIIKQLQKALLIADIQEKIIKRQLHHCNCRDEIS